MIKKFLTVKLLAGFLELCLISLSFINFEWLLPENILRYFWKIFEISENPPIYPGRNIPELGNSI